MVSIDTGRSTLFALKGVTESIRYHSFSTGKHQPIAEYERRGNRVVGAYVSALPTRLTRSFQDSLPAWWGRNTLPPGTGTSSSGVTVGTSWWYVLRPQS